MDNCYGFIHERLSRTDLGRYPHDHFAEKYGHVCYVDISYWCEFRNIRRAEWSYDYFYDCSRNRRLCHYSYLLETGEIVMQGTGKELLASPEIRKAYLGE